MAKAYSITTGSTRTFGTVDYVMFAALFCISAAIGFYHAIRDRNKKSTENFYFGGRKMHPIPVSLSLMATFLSALTLLGSPAEIYTYTTMYYYIVLAMLMATAGSAHVFMPVFYKLKVTSVFQYLEMRFGKLVQVVASAGYILQTLVYIAFVLTPPSLALEVVTGLSFWASLLTVGCVGTFYTMLGGMKTVLWTDSVQVIIMFAGLVWVLVQGCIETGGFAEAWEVADKHGRIYFGDFDPDPRTRHTFWTLSIGGGFFWLYLYGANQAQIQRASSLPTLKQAKIALWLNYPFLLLIVTLLCMIGVVMFAFYSDCDPVKYKVIERKDQLLPLFVMDILGTLPGVPGIFVACIFSGSLSTLSSGLNALSANLLEDFVRPICFCGKLSQRLSVWLSRLFVVITGAASIGLAILVYEFPGLIMQFSYSLYSVLAGPLFGLFVSGMIFPWTNKWGALVGYVLSLALMCWLAMGSLLGKLFTPGMPVSTEGCPVINTTATATTTTMPPPTTTEMPGVYEFYRMSYLWYTGFGMAANVVIALVVSFITGYTRPSKVDPRLMCPIFDNMFPCIPEVIRKPLRFGVNYEGINDYKDRPEDSEKYKADDIVNVKNGAINYGYEKGEKGPPPYSNTDDKTDWGYTTRM